MASKLLILEGLMQGDLDANHFRIVNLDTSNLPPSGIPPTVNPPASNWLNGWDATLLEWSYARPRFADIDQFLTTPQMTHINALGIVRVGTWEANPIDRSFLPTLDRIIVPAADVSLNNKKITNLANPTLPQDAVNLRFMDSLLQGLNPKEAVRCATTGNRSLAGLSLPVDGITVLAGDRVLVKSQALVKDNGIYIAATGVWSRSTDADHGTLDGGVNKGNDINGAYCTVTEGTLNGGTSWVNTAQVDHIAGGPSEGAVFVVFSTGIGAEAGDGLFAVGNVFNVGGTTDRISVGSDSVDIASTYAGQHSIHVLGTVDDGTWHGTILEPAYGGTGVANAYNITLLGAFTVALAGLAVPGTPLTFNVTGPTTLNLPETGKLATLAGAETFTNKRITKRVVKIASAAAPVINTDAVDVGYLTAMSTNPDMSANLSGTPTDSQELVLWFFDNGVSRTFTWGAKFAAGSEVALPSGTNPGFWTLCKFLYSTEKNQWVITDALTHI